MKPFKAPKQVLGDLEPDEVASLVATAADVSLVLDETGIIRDLALGSDDLTMEGYGQWVGKPWVDTVTVESRGKIEALLRDASSPANVRWRQVNHPSSRGHDVPVMYSAIQVGEGGRVVAMGRDLRGVAALQRRLVEAQQSMEREYARLRHAETRYRLLFQVSSEAVLIMDAATHKVVEANPAAGELLGDSPHKLVGRVFPEGFDLENTQMVQDMLATVRATGRAEDILVHSLGAEREFIISSSLFRQDNASHFLVRLRCPRSEALASVGPQSASRVLQMVERAPDGFVVTDMSGRIHSANPAFLEMAQLPTEEQARGESLGRWLGRPGVDLGVLIGNLREHGAVRLFATALRGEYGSASEVEISAVAVLGLDEPCLGFTIRNVGARLARETMVNRDGPRSVEQLTELVGRVPLKDLVRESTDMIERLCIEAALELTNDNRASAAEMLGLSRQSFYVKLRRYGLGHLAHENEEKL
ncbi:transcriptional regulator PpsR [Ectothiorhodospira variabilis]|uniref:transcriptional regulator PpsR n=1 Tax=Ectothiorhodospira variabilis TaxID=505694 RepID=UPI001EFB7FE3|nr:transcriptional regulator PpsR [Ectothiorhodospira variabilis]